MTEPQRQRHPRLKLTKDEAAALVELTAALVSFGRQKRAVKAAIRAFIQARHGRTVSAWTCEDFIRQAKDRLVDAPGEWPRIPLTDPRRAESVGFYRDVLADPTATRKDKLRARERLAKITGVESHRGLSIRGKPVTAAMTDEELVRLALGDGVTASGEGASASHGRSQV
jgi:hypothetical protein